MRRRNGSLVLRVWASNADKVSVIGDFNGWDGNRNEMVRDDQGCWFANIAEANFGQEYRFEIRSGSHRFTRVDSFAKSVTNSVGNGILMDLEFDWGDGRYELPPRNEIVLYEMHIGTFHVKEPGRPSMSIPIRN